MSTLRERPGTKALLLTMTLVASSLLVPATATAVPPSSASTTSSTILSGDHWASVSWPGSQDWDTYWVIDDRDQEVLWSGDATTARVSVPESSADLLVVGQRGDHYQLLQRNIQFFAAPDRLIRGAQAVITAAGTRVAWDGQREDGLSKLYLDGDPVGEAPSDVAELPVTVGEQASIEVDVPTVSESGDELVHTIGFDIEEPRTRFADAGPFTVGDTLPTLLPTVSATKMQYEVYIPMQYVPSPPSSPIGNFPCDADVGKDYWFGGDDRGVLFGTGKYRTQATLQYSWRSGVAINYSDVSPSTRYIKNSDGTYTFESTRQASDEGISMINKIVHDEGIGEILHSVGNPYCDDLFTIKYDIYEDVSRSGSYTVSGSHVKTPDHQLFRQLIMSDGSTQLHLVFHHPLDSFNCLFIMMCVPQTYEYQYAG